MLPAAFDFLVKFIFPSNACSCDQSLACFFAGMPWGDHTYYRDDQGVRLRRSDGKRCRACISAVASLHSTQQAFDVVACLVHSLVAQMNYLG